MKPRVREDKNEVAKCPFCNEFFKEPERMETEMGECIGGKCSCGAVYCFDPTGHNVGEAYLDALVLAYGEDWGGVADDAYSEAVFAYDARTHRLTPVKETRRPDSSGKVVFIKAKI